MKQLSFEELRHIELNMLKELDRICKKHHLVYSLAFGTCLGAERHRGFIPWDDDIDVYMPRDDYEKLATILPEENTVYRLASYRDGESPNAFFKLVDPRTLIYEGFLGKRFPEAVWIDIFPLDRIVPDSPAVKATLRKRKLLNILRGTIVTDISTGANAAVRLVKKVICPLARHLDYIKVCRRIDELAKQTTTASGADNSLPYNEGYFGELIAGGRIVKASLLFPTSPTQFESHEFEGPAQSERYLEQIYGDWRQLPPKSQQVPHFVEAYWL